MKNEQDVGASPSAPRYNTSIERVERRTVPEVGSDERARIVRFHERVEGRWWPVETAAVTPRWALYPEPICATCGEPWGRDGCSTVRAVTRLECIEIEAQRLRAEEGRLTQLLAEQVRRERRYNPDRRVIELHYSLDERLLMLGGLKVIRHACEDNYREFAKWHREKTATWQDKFAEALADSERSARRSELPNPKGEALK